MGCARLAQLQRNYTKWDAIRDAVRTRLQQRMGVCKQGEFLALSDELDRASAAADAAQAALDEHISLHCCMVQGSMGTASE
jgi:hypothetical protein